MILAGALKRLLLFSCLLTVLSACAGSSKYMVAKEPVLKPVEGKALVYIFRPSGFSFRINFQIWDGDRFIGLSQAKSYFQYSADPGKHTFLAIAENKAFIEADLAADKQYYIVTEPRIGVWRPRVGFLPVKRGTGEWSKVSEWKTGLINVVPVEAEVKAWQELKHEEAVTILKYFEEEYRKTGRYSTIGLEDGE